MTYNFHTHRQLKMDLAGASRNVVGAGRTLTKAKLAMWDPTPWRKKYHDALRWQSIRRDKLEAYEAEYREDIEELAARRVLQTKRIEDAARSMVPG